ncbi:TetR family transcriptional regulator [Micromonospora sp. NPDC002296]|uniref:TetR/AcrR family transcriptional regulator n=1 Tax=Micromonospora sp. NPDC002296 TaxID=3154271 RepID=UPI0033338770
MTQTPVGRRERKKAATRQAIADEALRLFLERGYDEVSVRDIADAADVSTTTLFKHFTGKEALVFDQDQENEAQLIAAVRRRADGQGIVDALREYALGAYLPTALHPQAAEFNDLVESTPALRDYAERMWTRHTDSLSAAVADELGVEQDDIACVALARFVLQIPSLIRGQSDRRAAVERVFDVIAHGWRSPESPPPGREGSGSAPARSTTSA